MEKLPIGVRTGIGAAVAIVGKLINVRNEMNHRMAAPKLQSRTLQ